MQPGLRACQRLRNTTRRLLAFWRTFSLRCRFSSSFINVKFCCQQPVRVTILNHSFRFSHYLEALTHQLQADIGFIFPRFPLPIWKQRCCCWGGWNGPEYVLVSIDPWKREELWSSLWIRRFSQLQRSYNVLVSCDTLQSVVKVQQVFGSWRVGYDWSTLQHVFDPDKRPQERNSGRSANIPWIQFHWPKIPFEEYKA